MPMLEIRPQNKVNVLCTLEESIATLVNQYAAFAQASGDAVVNKALEYAFSKDAEFQKYRAANPAAPLALRVKKPAVVSASTRRGAKAKSVAAD
jgi:hypothetical protein